MKKLINQKNWTLDFYFKDLNQKQLLKLKKYFDLLCDFNQKINLVSRRSVIDLDHFADSILFFQKTQKFLKKKEKIIDFGTGAGFPGMVWAILDPHRIYTLVDKNRKKIEFLSWVKRELELFHVELLNKNFSDMEKESCFYGITRAVSQIPSFIRLLNPVFKEKAEIYFLKGPLWSDELENIDKWSIEHFDQYRVFKSQKNCHIIKATKNSS